jgi:FxsC-like protein
MTGYHHVRPAEGNVGPASDAQPYFFLSYARSDDDPFVEQFFRDLCAEVRVRAGLASSAEVGFFDTHSIGIGASWSSELVDALARCSSFLALCSPRYFLSPACGQEWQLFSDRIRWHLQTTGNRCHSLIPVLWLPPRRVPKAVGEIQYVNNMFGEVYRRDGLRQLLRLHRNRDDYLESLTILADQIVEHASVNTLLPMPAEAVPRFEDLRNAFQDQTAAVHLNGAVLAESTHGSMMALVAHNRSTYNHTHVQFVVAAPDQEQARSVRRHLEFYGADSLDWAPYLPSMAKPLATFACEVAAKQGLTSEAFRLSDPCGKQASPGRDSTGRENIVVLLVDAWAPQLESFRRELTQFEIRPAPANAAMVPRSKGDHETSENWPQLSEGLKSIFVKRASTTEATALCSAILSHRAFDEDLQSVFEVARNRNFARGRADSAGKTAARARPILEGP